MITLEELLQHIRATSDNNPQLVWEAKQMYALVSNAPIEERFGIIYSIIGPNIDVLCDICSMFDVEIEAFEIHYNIDGHPYSQEVEILDDEELDYYENIEVEDDLDIIVSQAIFEEDMRRYNEMHEEQENPNDIVNRIYNALMVESDSDNMFPL